MKPNPQPLEFDALAGFVEDDSFAAFVAFRDWARAACADATPLRTAKPPSARLREIARVACTATIADSGRRDVFSSAISAPGASSRRTWMARPSSPAIMSRRSTPP